jgi:hypothetical protein
MGFPFNFQRALVRALNALVLVNMTLHSAMTGKAFCCALEYPEGTQ